MYQSHMRVVSIIVRIIFQMPGDGIDQCTMIVSVSGVHNQPGRLVHHHQVFVFVDNIQGNVFRNNLIIVAGTIHHHRNHIQRFHLIATLHGLAVSHDKTVFSSLLYAIARSIDDAFKQIFIYPDHRLPFVHYHTEMLVELVLITYRFYIIQFVLFKFVRQFFYHAFFLRIRFLH